MDLLSNSDYVPGLGTSLKSICGQGGYGSIQPAWDNSLGALLSTEVRLKQAQFIIEHSLASHAIKNELKKFGYTKDKLREGKAILDDAFVKYERESEYENFQDTLSDTTRELFFKAQDRYSDHRKIGHVAFKSDPIALKKLGLSDRPKRALTGLVEQMLHFYRAILDDDYFVGKYSEYGVNYEILYETCTIVEKIFNTQISENLAEIRSIIEDCDKALDKLEDWTNDFYTIAEIALKRRPQLLKQLHMQWNAINNESAPPDQAKQ